MGKIKLVCFDLDDTLIKTIHSVMYLCILNDKLKQLLVIEKQEANDELHWVEADHLKAKLIKGLSEAKIQEELDNILKPLNKISDVTEILHQNNIQSIIVTAGPKQVAKAVKEKWGFDGYYGSNYEVVNGVFTGKILKHIGDIGKITCLEDYCNKYKINPDDCIAVGDGVSDIPIFEYCKTSIAINYSPLVEGKATHYLNTNDLFEIMQYIL